MIKKVMVTLRRVMSIDLIGEVHTRRLQGTSNHLF